MRLVQLPVSKVILDADQITMIGRSGIGEYHVVLGSAPAMPKIGDDDFKVLLGALKFETPAAPEAPSKVLAANA